MLCSLSQRLSLTVSQGLLSAISGQDSYWLWKRHWLANRYSSRWRRLQLGSKHLLFRATFLRIPDHPSPAMVSACEIRIHQRNNLGRSSGCSCCMQKLCRLTGRSIFPGRYGGCYCACLGCLHFSVGKAHLRPNFSFCASKPPF